MSRLTATEHNPRATKEKARTFLVRAFLLLSDAQRDTGAGIGTTLTLKSLRGGRTFGPGTGILPSGDMIGPDEC